MALKPTMEGMNEAAAQFLEPGEELVTIGWASEKGTKFYYVALTGKRLLIIKLSTFYKVKGAESIPIEELEGVSIYEGFKYALPDAQLISSMVETSLYVKTKDGKKRAFRFARILGLDNKQVPVDIMETLKIGA
ncbi:MAG: hypothetical protein KKF41_00015 [Actinobacteria bacterium]|nr:hypothetical protein [Actinomycetota bacterium]MBU1943228.1 hypothetical protein [Actinomycetota bacterium]MBU2685951.1 hypothetical protein [Actinomycetota bacterium]